MGRILKNLKYCLYYFRKLRRQRKKHQKTTTIIILVYFLLILFLCMSFKSLFNINCLKKLDKEILSVLAGSNFIAVVRSRSQQEFTKDDLPN